MTPVSPATPPQFPSFPVQAPVASAVLVPERYVVEEVPLQFAMPPAHASIGNAPNASTPVTVSSPETPRISGMACVPVAP
ncbi:hypothetical protein B0G83_1125 [Paraburkholderia sp. BL21I4N1]|nr:hypothetical protein B0G83_1125 [Paraburkholderia sp. BL21I4N1]